MAKLPITRYKSNLIDQMDIGDKGYTVPWAMWVNLKGDCFLHPNFEIKKDKGGTLQMIVERTLDGYIVDLSFCETEYQPVEEPSYIRDPVDWITIYKIKS